MGEPLNERYTITFVLPVVVPPGADSDEAVDAAIASLESYGIGYADVCAEYDGFTDDPTSWPS